jgi:hypothetical protein
MKSKLKELVKNYIYGVKEAVESEFENNNYYSFDYLDEIENIINNDYENITKADIEEIEKAIKDEIIKIYGDNNCYYDAVEHMIPIDGTIKTIYAQMVIVSNN